MSTTENERRRLLGARVCLAGMTAEEMQERIKRLVLRMRETDRRRRELALKMANDKTGR
jgi:hypothetical protein